MIKDQRFRPYLVSLIIMVIHVIFLFISFTESDYSLFGTNLSSPFIQSLAFQTNDMFKNFGLNLLTSFFTHLNFTHLLLNLALFSLLSFNLEKFFLKTEYALTLSLSHICPLLIISLFLNETHYFLGNSLVCYALLSLVALITKKYYFFALALTLMSLNLIFYEVDWFSLGMHLAGMIWGVLYFFTTTKLFGRRYKANNTFHIN